MPNSISQWDIYWTRRYPESVLCPHCNRDFTLDPYQLCFYCGKKSRVSNFMTKPRPALIVINQIYWYESMSFAIPLSTDNVLKIDRCNEIIQIADFDFFGPNLNERRPMRAVIHQATRIDGNTLKSKDFIGHLKNEVKIRTIESKLFEWVFKSN